MIGDTIKSEFRKLFTVRSTYVVMGLALAAILIFTVYFEGFRGNTGSPAAELTPLAFKEIVANGGGLVVTFASIIAILFMSHEYRYNTIIYTLTANTRRTRVLFAKLSVIVMFSICFGVSAVLVALGGYMFGLSFRDATLPAQDFHILPELGKIVFYYTGYALVGILLAIVTRSVVMSIATLFIFPTTVEPLLGLLLKDNTKYLPFTALDSTTGATLMDNPLSTGAAIAVASIYLVSGTFIAWFIFTRRDAL